MQIVRLMLLDFSLSVFSESLCTASELIQFNVINKRNNNQTRNRVYSKLDQLRQRQRKAEAGGGPARVEATRRRQDDCARAG